MNARTHLNTVAARCRARPAIGVELLLVAVCMVFSARALAAGHGMDATIWAALATLPLCWAQRLVRQTTINTDT